MKLSTSLNNPLFTLKDILLQKNDGDNHIERYVKNVSKIDIRTQILELKHSNYGVNTKHINDFFQTYKTFHQHELNAYTLPKTTNHPVQIILKENKALLTLLSEIERSLSALSSDSNNFKEQKIATLQENMKNLGQFYCHYNRLEKLYFPIMERYKQYIIPRIMWANNDAVRTLYKGTQRMMENIAHIDLIHIERSFASFVFKMKEVIFDEEQLFLPIVVELFTEDNWQDIKLESNAFGYTLIDNQPSKEGIEHKEAENDTITNEIAQHHLPFGGGFLTVKEANIILNNLPLEITFIDQQGIFKYFNNITKAADMMFIRTPLSIGRHVSNCHPPKSMGKVMRLIRDLKSGRRTSETMWFKKKDHYIHITYKAVFDDENCFVGILEYVQDIQDFFDLPRETKRELLSLEE